MLHLVSHEFLLCFHKPVSQIPDVKIEQLPVTKLTCKGRGNYREIFTPASYQFFGFSILSVTVLVMNSRAFPIFLMSMSFNSAKSALSNRASCLIGASISSLSFASAVTLFI